MNSATNGSVSNGAAAFIPTAEVGEGTPASPNVVVKITITDNERETVTKAFAAIFGVVKTMGKGGCEIPANFLTDSDSLSQLLGCAHRVWKEDAVQRERAIRESVGVKINAKINEALAKREKALAAYNSLPADLKSEMVAPSPTISLWVEDFVALFGKGYDLSRTTKTMHDMGYMVHAPKVDGRRKDAPTPPYLTATVGKPIRMSEGAKPEAK